VPLVPLACDMVAERAGLWVSGLAAVGAGVAGGGDTRVLMRGGDQRVSDDNYSQHTIFSAAKLSCRIRTVTVRWCVWLLCALQARNAG
jgi:hypothetical protein